MSEHLNSEEEDLLQSALTTAFSPAPLPRQSAAPEPAPELALEPAPPSAPAPEPTTSQTPSGPTLDGWKAEYDTHIAQWRQKSAEQRQKAEEQRAKWEEIRAKERKEGKGRESVLSLRDAHGWESLSASATTAATAAESPSPADARDLVAGEGEGGHSKEFLESVLPGAQASTSTASTPPENGASQPASEPESSKQEKWDDMTSSLTSSFPSMSFPSDPHSPSSSARRDLAAHGHGHHHSHHHGPGHVHGDVHAHEHGHHPHREGVETQTATLSVFNSALSPKTRALAVVSAIAINVLLPFVNGVMLGFGEIFAKNVVVRWIGWKIPGTASAATGQQGSGRVATNVGLGRK
ncbi:hypothetical protein C8Q78DRAFT_1029597 [Trametes maxima]|nr:hypothetical protein C8Q78DRAFT_1029597 [Trametes maxima]